MYVLLNEERHSEIKAFSPWTQHIDPSRSWTQSTLTRVQGTNHYATQWYSKHHFLSDQNFLVKWVILVKRLQWLKLSLHGSGKFLRDIITLTAIDLIGPIPAIILLITNPTCINAAAISTPEVSSFTRWTYNKQKWLNLGDADKNIHVSFTVA